MRDPATGERIFPFTRKAQAIDVLRTGGRVLVASERPRLLELRDASGRVMPAHQNAIIGACRHLAIEPEPPCA